MTSRTTLDADVYSTDPSNDLNEGFLENGDGNIGGR